MRRLFCLVEKSQQKGVLTDCAILSYKVNSVYRFMEYEKEKGNDF